MIEKLKSQIDSIVLGLFGIFVLAIIPVQISESSLSALGPRFFPYLLAGAIILLSAISIIKELFISSTANKDTPEDLADEKKPGYMSIGLTFISLLLWAFLVPVLGFVITTLLFVGVMMWITGNRNIVAISLTSILFTAATYYVFRIILQVFLPEGIFL